MGGSGGGERGQLRRLAASKTAGLHAGHAPSTYWLHSRRCLASAGIWEMAKPQLLRACWQTLRQMAICSPKAQPSMYEAQMNALSALVQPEPRSHVGMLPSSLAAVASAVLISSALRWVGAVCAEQLERWAVGSWQPHSDILDRAGVGENECCKL